MCGARVGHGARVQRADDDGVGCAAERTVADDELGHIGARPVGGKARVHRIRIDERSRAASGSRRERPGVGEYAPFRVGRCTAGELNQGAQGHRLVRSGVGRGSGVVGADRDARSGAVDQTVIDDELDNIAARLIGGEARVDRSRVAQCGRTACGAAEQRPAVGEAVAVHVGAEAAVELHQRTQRHRTAVARPRHRRRVEGGDHHGVGRAGEVAVVDDQLDLVAAGHIDDQARLHGAGVAEAGRAARRGIHDAPGIGECIAVHVAAEAPVQHHGVAHARRLVGARAGSRCGVARADGDGRCSAAQGTIAHHELDHIAASAVGGEARVDRGRTGQRSRAARRAAGDGPGIGQRIAIRVAGGCAVEGGQFAYTHGVVGTGVGQRRTVGRTAGVAATQHAGAAVDGVDGEVDVRVARVFCVCDGQLLDDGLLDQADVEPVDAAVVVDVALEGPGPRARQSQHQGNKAPREQSGNATHGDDLP